MYPLIAAHLLFLGLWGGLVLVEVVFEVQMISGRLNDIAVAKMHRLTDRYFELPILFAVVVTGWILWQRSGYPAELLPKVLFGLGAVIANVICYIIVELRASAALDLERKTVAEDSAGRLRKLSFALLYTIAPGFILAAITLFIGGVSIGWW